MNENTKFSIMFLKQVSTDKPDETWVVIEDMKSKLTERQFQILLFRLSYFKGIEIAMFMGYSPATISKEMEVIRKEFRRYLYGRIT